MESLGSPEEAFVTNLRWELYSCAMAHCRHCACSSSELESEKTLSLNIILGKLGVTKVEHLWDEVNQGWPNYNAKMARMRNVPHGQWDLLSTFLETFLTTESTTSKTQVNSDLWQWSNNLLTNEGFVLSNAQIYTLLLQESTEWEHLNRRWSRTDNQQTWEMRWKRCGVRILHDKQRCFCGRFSWMASSLRSMPWSWDEEIEVVSPVLGY